MFKTLIYGTFHGWLPPCNSCRNDSKIKANGISTKITLNLDVLSNLSSYVLNVESDLTECKNFCPLKKCVWLQNDSGKWKLATK